MWSAVPLWFGRAVRNGGPLDVVIADLRHRKALKLLRALHAAGGLLDIGCGFEPLFLLRSSFAEKTGVEKPSNSNAAELCARHGIRFHLWDATELRVLPIDGDSMGSVTLLAVIEHMEERFVAHVLAEAARTLGDGGVLVVTTPSKMAAPILRFLATVGVISKEELEEHGPLYGRGHVLSMLRGAGFEERQLRSGYFELGLNMWFTAVKGGC